ncbi:hypothetical protein [Vibrio apostichopi]|uniref:hypothetical protein n=1 Tax=Vibrio apostichopi TaxID=3035453 RepID=UPI0025748DE5|nr:hypothetical protein [Vibrio sp. FE10]
MKSLVLYVVSTDLTSNSTYHALGIIFEYFRLTFLTDDTGILRHILALLHVQGSVHEEKTMHPLALPRGRNGTNVVYKDYALASILVGVGVGVGVAYKF